MTEQLWQHPPFGSAPIWERTRGHSPYVCFAGHRGEAGGYHRGACRWLWVLSARWPMCPVQCIPALSEKSLWDFSPSSFWLLLSSPRFFISFSFSSVCWFCDCMHLGNKQQRKSSADCGSGLVWFDLSNLVKSERRYNGWRIWHSLEVSLWKRTGIHRSTYPSSQGLLPLFIF